MCPFGFSTKDLVSGMEDYCLQRRTEMLESYWKSWKCKKCGWSDLEF